MEQNYCIRQAKLEDQNSIVDFFNHEWKKAQTLNDSRLFNYYYINDEELNFVIAIRDGMLVGACGFIIARKEDVWISNLLVKKGENPMLVLRIIKFFEEKKLNIFGMGIEKNTQGFYKILGYEVGGLKHYYKLFDWSEYKIANVSKKWIYSNMSNHYKVIELNSEKTLMEKINDSIFSQQRPRKSLEYIIKRYYRFPYEQYKYKVWAIEVAENTISTLFVTREQEVQVEDYRRKVWRIVDVIGSETELLGIGKFFEEQGSINNYEYVDCWCYGINDNIMKQLGFVCDDVNIIPDRLDPLEKKDEEIIFFNQNYSNFRAFRADGDWDRPNIWYNASLNEVSK